jgi:hypothetical protein
MKEMSLVGTMSKTDKNLQMELITQSCIIVCERESFPTSGPV